jgi:hypothetical protein
MAEERLGTSWVGGRHPRLRRPWFVLLRLAVLAFGVFVAMGGRDGAGAWAGGTSDAIRLAQREQTRISVAETILAEAASVIAIHIEIGSPRTLPKNCFVRLRGLPPSVSLTEGYSIGPGSWAIPLFGLATLKASVPAGAAGRSELFISLVGIDGSLIAQATSTFIVGPSAVLAQSGKLSSEPQQQFFASPPLPLPAVRSDRNDKATRPLEAPEETRLIALGERYIAQGEQYLSEGNVAIARQFFQRAADAGYAPGAMRLAATYDPAEYSQLQLQGIIPDLALARRWYERARDLGAPGADERLARLERN